MTEQRIKIAAIGSFIQVNADSYQCRICDKVYKRKGNLEVHIPTEHGAELDAKATELEAKNLEFEIQFIIGSIGGEIESKIADYDKTLDAYLKYIAEYGPLSAAEWKLTKMAEAETISIEAQYAEKKWIEYASKKDYVSFFLYIDDRVTHLKDQLLRCPHRNSSTNQIANAVEEAKFNAKCYMVSDGFGFLTRLRYDIDKLTTMLEKQVS